MTKQPWMKFYPADWRADPALRMCQPISRYVWLEMIGIMHEAEPYGHFVINGNPVSADALSRLINVSAKVVNYAMKDLARHGVYTVNNDGIIVSRRMVRDELKASSSRVHGTRGGNPALKKQQDSAIQVNPTVKRGDKAQIPEARSQKPDSKKIEPDGSKKIGSRLPADWALDDDCKQFAIEAGFTGSNLQSLADNFRDYWISVSGQRGTKLDWPATWRNWVRKADKPRQHAPPRKSAHVERHDEARRILEESILARRQTEHEHASTPPTIELDADDWSPFGTVIGGRQ